MRALGFEAWCSTEITAPAAAASPASVPAASSLPRGPIQDFTRLTSGREGLFGEAHLPGKLADTCRRAILIAIGQRSTRIGNTWHRGWRA